MKGDINKINIKNIQTNFQLRLKSPLLTNNPLIKQTKEKPTLTDRSKDKNILKSTRGVSKDNSSKVIPSYVPTITSITNTGFIPNKIFNKSSVQEIHNNVYNFYGNHSNNATTTKKDISEVSLEKNINEKNEYIKYLMSENSTLKFKLQEKAKENKNLLTEIQLIDKSNYLKQTKTTQQSPVKSKIII